jgi:hypothetical protein
MNKKISLNWGYSIVIVFVLFVGLMITFIVIASKRPVNLTVKDYYKAEIEYQKTIESEKLYDKLLHQPITNISDKQISIDFTTLQNDTIKPLKGVIKFYKADNPSADFSIPFDSKIALIPIDVSNKNKGKWNIEINWVDLNGNLYSHKKDIFLK